MRFLFVIFIFLLIYYILKGFFRMIFPSSDKNKFYNQQNKKQGDITIEQITKEKRKKNNDGEYIDYEEIK